MTNHPTGRTLLPNMRLKLAGVIALVEAECLRPSGARTPSTIVAHGGLGPAA